MFKNFNYRYLFSVKLYYNLKGYPTNGII